MESDSQRIELLHVAAQAPYVYGGARSRLLLQRRLAELRRARDRFRLWGSGSEALSPLPFSACMHRQPLSTPGRWPPATSHHICVPIDAGGLARSVRAAGEAQDRLLGLVHVSPVVVVVVMVVEGDDRG